MGNVFCLFFYYFYCSCIGDVIGSLRTKVCNEIFSFVVRREHVLNDAIMQMDGLSYSPNKRIDVWCTLKFGSVLIE